MLAGGLFQVFDEHGSLLYQSPGLARHRVTTSPPPPPPIGAHGRYDEPTPIASVVAPRRRHRVPDGRPGRLARTHGVAAGPHGRCRTHDRGRRAPAVLQRVPSTLRLVAGAVGALPPRRGDRGRVLDRRPGAGPGGRHHSRGARARSRQPVGTPHRPLRPGRTAAPVRDPQRPAGAHRRVGVAHTPVHRRRLPRTARAAGARSRPRPSTPSDASGRARPCSRHSRRCSANRSARRNSSTACWRWREATPITDTHRECRPT